MGERYLCASYPSQAARKQAATSNSSNPEAQACNHRASSVRPRQQFPIMRLLSRRSSRTQGNRSVNHRKISIRR